jgi:hypothetical protein
VRAHNLKKDQGASVCASSPNDVILVLLPGPFTCLSFLFSAACDRPPLVSLVSRGEQRLLLRHRVLIYLIMQSAVGLLPLILIRGATFFFFFFFSFFFFYLHTRSPGYFLERDTREGVCVCVCVSERAGRGDQVTKS